MRWIAWMIFCFLLNSCSDSNPQFGRKVKALGVPNQIAVIADEDMWESFVGDTLREYLESVYPVLPRPEPLFDLRLFTPFDLRVEKLRRELRTYLIVASADHPESEAYGLVKKNLGSKVDFSKIQLNRNKDEWASGQLLLYYSGPTDSLLAKKLAEYLPAITQEVAEHDYTPIRAKAFLQGERKSLSTKLDSLFGIKMKVPSDYIQAELQDSFIWLRRDFEDITSNILMRELPYTSKGQFTKEYIKSIRNYLGEVYVKSNTEGSYMIINDSDLPMYTFTKQVNGTYAMQAKGIWEMNKDFMGGPFVSYLILREDRKSLLFIDAFVLALGRQKRNMMQELETIVEGMEF